LPASSPAAVLTLLVVLTASSVVSIHFTMNGGLSNDKLIPIPASSLGKALEWLAANQSSDGSYGAYHEHTAGAAAYALWLNYSDSPKAALSYLWLATQLNSSSAWFWGVEADVPGVALYSLATSHNLALVNSTFVKGQLLQLQDSTTGGFEGYSYCSSNCNTAYPTYLTVTSSVDTDMALLGLISSNLILDQNRTLAIQYLLTLQNPDGSFNLTNTIPYDPVYSQGPDSVAITALTLLVLKSDGFTTDNATISKGLNFLSERALSNLCSDGHTYSAALSTLAFKAYDQPDDAARSSSYILSQQNSDGGFSDASRSYYPESNALDTGWVAVALETQPLEGGDTSQIKNCPPVADFSFTPQTVITGVSVHFNASASHDQDSDGPSYNWTFGDGSSAHGVSPAHTYAHVGNFTVTLTIIDSGTNPGPLSDTKSLTLTVNPTVVQNSSTFTLGSTGVWIIVGVVGLVAIIGVAFYLGRRSVKMSVTSA
jgi:prenyltransferase beta subunit